MATMGVLHDYNVAEYCTICQRAGTELVYGDDVGYCMAIMLPNIALFAETGQRGTLNPLCLAAAGEYKATGELVEDSWMATMGCCMAAILGNA
jgi:hypothetical protein